MTAPIIPQELDDKGRAELQAKVAQARARGFDDQTIDGYLQQRFGVGLGQVYASPMPQHGAARTAVDNAANGVLWGMGTRLSAVASSVANSKGHDLSLYRFYLDALQKQNRQSAEAHPAAAISGAIAGAAASPLNKILPVGGKGATGVALRSGAGGMIAGGIGGAADAPAGETVSGGVKGAAFGGVMGALIPGGVALARQSFSAPFAAATRLANLIKSAGGEKALTAEAERLAQLGRGETVMLSDLHPKLGALADQVATTSDDARQVIKAASEARQSGMSERVLADVRAGLKGAEPSIAERQTALETARREWAKSPAGFQGLRDMNLRFDPKAFVQELQPYLEQPVVKKAMEEARTTGLIGEIPDTRRPASYQMLQDVKEALDDKIESAFRAGHGNLGERLGQARDAVRGFLEKHVPDYADVSAKYQQMKRLEDALKEGAEWWGKHDLKGLERHLATLNPAELEQFRTGLASKLVEQLSSAKTNRDVATALTKASRSEQAKLKLIFGDQATFTRFMEQMAAEHQMAELRGASAGSATARRLSAGANALASALGGAAAYAHNPLLAVGALATKGAEMAARRAMVGSANELARDLTTTGAPAIKQLLGRLGTNRAPALTPVLQRSLTGAAGGAGGLLGPQTLR